MHETFKGHPVVAAFLDFTMRPLRKLRPKIVAQARGKVLEIGVGTGLNFAEYREIESLCGVEPDPHMLQRARERARELPFEVELTQCGAEKLPYPNGHFDTVITTWVLCTVSNPLGSLSEIYRVLRPGGVFIFAEHTRSAFPLARRLQDFFNPLWRRFAGGCNMNRDSVLSIRRSGFAEVSVSPCGRESWRVLPMYRGTAVKAA